jgi:hypothetical protein
MSTELIQHSVNVFLKYSIPALPDVEAVLTIALNTTTL